MKFLHKQLQKVAPLFEKGGKLEKLYPLFEAGESFLFTPATPTTCGAHVRDGADVPVADRAVELRRAIEQFPHGRNLRDIPAVQVAVEEGSTLEHAINRGDLRDLLKRGIGCRGSRWWTIGRESTEVLERQGGK